MGWGTIWGEGSLGQGQGEAPCEQMPRIRPVLNAVQNKHALIWRRGWQGSVLPHFPDEETEMQEHKCRSTPGLTAHRAWWRWGPVSPGCPQFELLKPGGGGMDGCHGDTGKRQEGSPDTAAVRLPGSASLPSLLRGLQAPTQDHICPLGLAKGLPEHPASSLTIFLTLRPAELLIDSFRDCYFRPLSS